VKEDDAMSWHCPHCNADFSDSAANVVTIPDDRDQMYGRPLSGTRDVLACPDCGSIDIEEDCD
jgi:hypothetical protein